jgi:hypothetical protein
MLDPILQDLFLLNKLCHVTVCGILASIFLQDLQANPQILIFILILEYVGIKVIYHLALLLNILSQREVAL